MADLPGFEELITQLTRSSRLNAREATHLVDEVLAFLDDSVEQFVRRRHQQLQREGIPNADIYRQVAQEAAALRFRAPGLSARQIRRLVYG
jgi:hypothetical protein